MMGPHESASPRKGLVYGLAAAAAFASMGLVVHLSPPSLPVSELVAIRAAGSILCLGPLAVRRLGTLVSPSSAAIWARSAFGALGIFCYFWTLKRCPVSASTVLADTAPVFVSLLLGLRARRVPPRREVLGLAVAMAGLLLLGHTGIVQLTGDVWAVGLLGACAAAFAYLSLAQAAARFSAAEIVFCLSLVLLLTASATPGETWQLPLQRDAPLLALIVVFSLAAQLLLTYSYKHLHPVVAAIVGLSACLWGALLEGLFEGHRLTLLEAGSYGLILGGIICIKALPAKFRSPLADPSKSAA